MEFVGRDKVRNCIGSIVSKRERLRELGRTGREISTRENLEVEISGLLGEIDDPVRSMLFMHAPPGILLTARPAYRVDDDETDIPLIWHNCTQRRCTAIRSLEIDEFDRLLAGGQIAIGYQRLAASQPTVFEVSLVGVTAGFDALAERLEAN